MSHWEIWLALATPGVVVFVSGVLYDVVASWWYRMKGNDDE